MHRHAYQGRKFGRQKDQRNALLKGLATQLVLHGKIKTTLIKAKELRPYVEVLITKAKAGTLADRRHILSVLTTVEAAHKLVDEIAPKLSHRTSGYLRITRTNLRVGDNTQMAIIAFVDDITDTNAKEASKKDAGKSTVPTKAKKPVAARAKATSAVKEEKQ